MIVELVNAASIQCGGLALVHAAGVRSVRMLIPLGFLIGLCVHLLIGGAQAVLLMQTWPWVTITLTAVVPGLVWWFRRGWKRLGLRQVGWAVAAVVGAALLATAFSLLDRINFHVDSLEYMSIGALLTSGTFAEGVSLYQLEKRLLAVPLMHAAGSSDESFYLASISPMLAVSTVWLLVSMCLTGLKGHVSSKLLPWIAGGAGALLLTTNRFVHNAFYINGHMLFAAMFLVLIGLAWLAARGDLPKLVPLMLVAIPVLVITRAEAPLMLVLALGPVLLSSIWTQTERMALLTTLGGSVVVWQLFLLFIHYRAETSVSMSLVGMLAFGCMLLVTWPLLGTRVLERRPLHTLTSIEVGLWLALFAMVARDAEPMLMSARATWENIFVGTGGWGLTITYLTLISVGALAAVRPQARHFLRYPLTTFIPVALLLVYLRGGAYRVAEADSLNRMLFHIVPLAVLFVGASACRASTPDEATATSPPSPQLDHDRT